MLEFITLGILYKHPLTGYDIRKHIEQGVGLFYKASYGSLYPLLKKMLDKGYVTCETGGAGKRETKIYEISAVGKMVFLKWLGEPVHRDITIEAFMAKVYFYDMLPIQDGKQHIVEYRESLIEYLNELKELSNTFQKAEEPNQFYFKISTLYYGIIKLESMIQWCDDVLENKVINNIFKNGGNYDADSKTN